MPPTSVARREGARTLVELALDPPAKAEVHKIVLVSPKIGDQAEAADHAAMLRPLFEDPAARAAIAYLTCV